MRRGVGEGKEGSRRGEGKDVGRRVGRRGTGRRNAACVRVPERRNACNHTYSHRKFCLILEPLSSGQERECMNELVTLREGVAN